MIGTLKTLWHTAQNHFYRLMTSRIIFTPEQREHLLHWAQWLEEGNFQQGEASLCTNNAYCCLGVYAAMQHPEEWHVDAEGAGSIEVRRPDSWYQTTVTLPADYRRELGLDHSYGGQILVKHFTDMNDNLHWTFPRIAQEIRSLLDTGYFTKEFSRLAQDQKTKDIPS